MVRFSPETGRGADGRVLALPVKDFPGTDSMAGQGVSAPQGARNTAAVSVEAPHPPLSSHHPSRNPGLLDLGPADVLDRSFFVVGAAALASAHQVLEARCPLPAVTTQNRLQTLGHGWE